MKHFSDSLSKLDDRQRLLQNTDPLDYYTTRVHRHNAQTQIQDKKTTARS